MIPIGVCLPPSRSRTRRRKSPDLAMLHDLDDRDGLGFVLQCAFVRTCAAVEGTARLIARVHPDDLLGQVVRQFIVLGAGRLSANLKGILVEAVRHNLIDSRGHAVLAQKRAADCLAVVRRERSLEVVYPPEITARDAQKLRDVLFHGDGIDRRQLQVIADQQHPLSSLHCDDQFHWRCPCGLVHDDPVIG